MEYRFELKGASTGESYQIVQDYGAGNQTFYLWDTAGIEGTHLIRVSVRRAGSDDIPIRKAIRVDVNPAEAVSNLTLTRNLTSPQTAGAVYRVDALASGAVGEVEYLFELKGPSTGNRYQIVQDYGAGDKTFYSWDTTGMEGNYYIRVSARRAGSNDVPYKKSIRVFVTAP